jgi:hypothetical protein
MPEQPSAEGLPATETYVMTSLFSVPQFPHSKVMTSLPKKIAGRIALIAMIFEVLLFGQK